MNKEQLTQLLESQQLVFEKIIQGVVLSECLTTICTQIEKVIGSSQAKSSILLLKGNQLHHGAAPRLPQQYCEAIDGVVIGPGVGSCGTAAYTGEQTIVSDIEHDPLWIDFKDFALGHDLRACWSTPILSSKKIVLGTFAIYYPKVKKPNAFHLEIISRFTHLASFAIEKQLNESSLRDSQNYNRSLFETSPIGLALCQLNGELVDVNSAYANIIGRSMEETLKLTYWDITPKKYQKNEEQQLANLERTGAYGPFEKEYIHQKGHLVPVRLSGMYLERKGETYIFSSVEDITQQNKAVDSMQRSQKMDAIGQLTGGIAHDFNNILGIIMGNIELLGNHLANDHKAAKHINRIEKSAQRAVDLTRQLLSFSRKQEAGLTSCNLNAVITGINSLLSRSITPEVEIKQHFSADLWPVKIASGDFEDVLLNLTLNARDAMPDGGTLTMETSNCELDAEYCLSNPDATEGEYVLFSISDTGTGIPKEIQDRIYEPFFTTKQEGDGTGLGLSMVFGFVNRSKGHIKLYSEDGLGTIFRLYLPHDKKLVDAETTSRLPEQTPELPKGNETILVVDDEEGLLELAKQTLHRLGYRVLTAINGKQALARLIETPDVNLMFSDVVMPGGINGYELAEQVNDLYPDIQILLTSGYSEKAITHNGQVRFETNLLHKPYTQSDLAIQVRRLLEKSTSQ